MSNGIKIGSNIASLQAQRGLSSTTNKLGTIFERLASGQRINRAADDAAGLAVAEKLHADSRVYGQAIRNANDGISLINIADGAIGELAGTIIRMRELASQAANGTYSAEQRQALNSEAQALVNEYNRISQSTEFNGVSLLDGTIGQTSIQVGYGTAEIISVSLPDLSAIQLGSSQIVGTGTLGAPATYTLTDRVLDIQFTDLNNDGILDILEVTDDNPNFLGTHLGNGNGTFQARQTVATTTQTTQVAAGDFNNDGDIDVVTADTGREAYGYHQGLGDGTLAARVSNGLPGSPASANQIEAAYLDQDSNLDLVIASGLKVFTILGAGDGSFAPVRSFDISLDGLGNDSTVLGDFNNDGEVDVATMGWSGPSGIAVHLGNGNGTLKAEVTTPDVAMYESLAAGDVNGDGKLDLVSVHYNNDLIKVYLGNGNGTFQFGGTYEATGPSPEHITLTDLNSDGMLDAVTADSQSVSGGMTVFLGNGNGTFNASVQYTRAGGPFTLEAADLNSDSIPDIAVGTYDSFEMLIFLTETEGGGEPTTQNLSDISLLTRTEALTSMDLLDDALTYVSNSRGTLGASQARLETALSNLKQRQENTVAARARIVDADVASESAQLVQLRILQQAAAAVLAQANSQPELALMLLRAPPV